MNIRTLIVAIIAAVTYTFTVSAQKLTEGSYRSLVGVSTVYTELDFSNASVNATDFSEYIEYKYYGTPKKFQENYEDDIVTLLGGFIIKFNEEEIPIRLTTRQDSHIHLIIKVRKVDEEGNQIWADCMFINKETRDVLASIDLEAEGGRFGSFMNLLGDTMEEAGEKLAWHLKWKIKREVKQMKKEEKENH